MHHNRPELKCRAFVKELMVAPIDFSLAQTPHVETARVCDIETGYNMASTLPPRFILSSVKARGHSPKRILHHLSRIWVCSYALIHCP